MMIDNGNNGNNDRAYSTARTAIPFDIPGDLSSDSGVRSGMSTGSDGTPGPSGPYGVTVTLY